MSNMAHEEQDPDELTMAYLHGVHDGKKQRVWVDLTEDELREFDIDPVEARMLIAKFKEKNHG